jgi:hypothetical protein
MAQRPSREGREAERAWFDLCVHGQPVSAQSGRRDLLDAWKQRVRTECKARWQGAPLQGDVRLRVTYFGERFRIDVDNLKKPIQDALQTVAYTDDRQVTDSEGRRRDINDAFRVRYISASLALAFSNGTPFVHIEIWANPDQEHVR